MTHDDIIKALREQRASLVSEEVANKASLHRIGEELYQASSRAERLHQRIQAVDAAIHSLMEHG